MTRKGIDVIEAMAMRPGWTPVRGLAPMSQEDAARVRDIMWRKYQYRSPGDAWWEQ
jgi:hypothetical protein